MSILQNLIRVSKEGNYDELYTPRRFVEILLKYIPKNVKTIWCPCDTADSEYVKVLSENGYNVIYTSLKEGTDFLTEIRECDMIITNPPFSNKDEIIRRCYELKVPFFLLLPEKASGGKRRISMYAKHGAGWIHLGERADFTGKGACWFNVQYLLHSDEHDGKCYYELYKKGENK